MLVLSRKLHESIVIDDRIVVKILRVDGFTVKVGIEAPAEVPIRRSELPGLKPSAQANGDAGLHVPEPDPTTKSPG